MQLLLTSPLLVALKYTEYSEKLLLNVSSFCRYYCVLTAYSLRTSSRTPYSERSEALTNSSDALLKIQDKTVILLYSDSKFAVEKCRRNAKCF